MSDVMCVRLHLSGVRVRGVGVDSVERLEVEVESVREWSRCRHCGFRCFRVWDRRPKRVRDLGVSGRRTTLVWRRRRFECGNCVSSYVKLGAGLGGWRWVQMRSEMRRLRARIASRWVFPRVMSFW